MLIVLYKIVAITDINVGIGKRVFGSFLGKITQKWEEKRREKSEG